MNCLSSFESEDLRAESHFGIMEVVSKERNFLSGHVQQTQKSLDKLSLERAVEGNGDHNGAQAHQSQCQSEECDSGCPVIISLDSADERGYMSQNVVKTNEHDPGSFSEDGSMQYEENKGTTSQQISKQVEDDTLLLQLTWNENKGNFLSKSEDFFCCESIDKIDSNSTFVDPKVFLINDFETNSPSSTGLENDQLGDSNTDDNLQRSLLNTKSHTGIIGDKIHGEDINIPEEKEGKYFYYDSPFHEDTGVWIPVSVPPMSESEHQEWTRGFCSTGGYLPEGDAGWGQHLREEKELTMWDVVVEMVLAARGKVNSLASGDIPDISWISSHLIEQAWKEMAQTLADSSLSNVQQILEAEPPKWLPDSTASTCMLCSVRFHPIMCTRHHCRFCGGIFCSDCTKGRSLVPQKFRTSDPQRVCDVCCVRLESAQSYLMDQVSRSAQLPTHDLTDLSTLRSWLNFPWGQSMEYEIYKATNTIRGYSKVGSLRPEKRIPEAILRHAKGLAILTVVRVGMMVTYNIGTGLVIARREDGSWSPPSAASSFGVGWGAQAGGELIDLIIVLRTEEAIRTFTGNTHLSVGAGLSAAIGIIGRTAEVDLRAGTSGYAACYTYSSSKGAFIGCSLEGSIVATRAQENSRFYGSQFITASDILLGSLPRPPAASILYHALADLYKKL